VNASLLFAVLSRRLTKPAALVGASLFAVHPALFTALYWQSARADILAATFALCTMILALRPGRDRWFAVPVFALSLLSKESMLPLPLVVLLLQKWRGLRRARSNTDTHVRVDPVLVSLFVLSASYLPYLARPGSASIRIGFDPEAAYAFAFGSSLFRNLLTYVGWTVDLAMARPGLRFVDRQNPDLFPLAITVLIAVGVLALWPSLRRRGWLVGFGGFLLLLLTVLPLRNHAYHYYLYAPLLGAALCVGALVDSLLGLVSSSGVPGGVTRERRRADVAGTARRVHAGHWVVAGLCWLALTWNGARLVARMESRPSPVYPGLRGDPIVDRALIAERAITGLRAAQIPPGTELVFVMRERIALIARIVRGSGEEPPPPQEVYPETNFKAALFDGLGVRALLPAVDSVSFALGLGVPTAKRRYAIYAPTGEVEVFDATSVDSLLRSSWVMRW
jgi:hypothetical protein